VAENRSKPRESKIRSQSRRLHDAMAWLLRGFTLSDPRKRYPDFYLSPQQSYVLTVIHDKGEISPGEVAKILRLEKSHLTKIVNSLIELKAIDKHTDERDRRRLVLTLTDKGKQIFDDLDRASVDSYEALMVNVAEDERENVIRATEVMLEAMNKLRQKKG